MAHDHEHRPDPDALLKQVQVEEPESTRGKLKIFFGACAGVGKTFSMMNSAHERIREGLDVVVGVIETHGRPETEKLLDGLPTIPQRQIDHRGVLLHEFDLDAAIARKPAVILLDEFAHTNAPGSRHPKRWQDVEELLQEGINVYTTLNVQHLESLNDVVAEITGIWVKETVPDTIFDKADEIVLVDIPSDELLKRLNEGKVYIANVAKKRAAQNFFKKSNLIALRELALRRTAERVDAQMSLYKTSRDGKDPLQLSDRVLVCLGPDPLSNKLARAAKRLATTLRAPWVAVYVENYRHYRLDKKSQAAVERHMRLAEQMGAKCEILHGDNAAEAIIAYARANGVTKIVVGKTNRPRWRELVYDTLVNAIVRLSGDIDIYVITGGRDGSKSSPQPAETSKRVIHWKRYFYAVLTVTVTTLLALPLRNLIEEVNLVMVFLVGVLFAAVKLGSGPSVLTAVLSAVCFVAFFIRPYSAFSLSDSEYFFTFGVMLFTGLLISRLASRLRVQASGARERERTTAALYAMTRELAASRGFQGLAAIGARHIGDVFRSHATIWMPDAYGVLAIVSEEKAELDIKEATVARWTFDHSQPAGLGTTTLPGSQAYYMPLVASGEMIGVLGVRPNEPDTLLSTENLAFLETFSSLAASSLERAAIADAAERSKIEAEGEKLRNILLSSVSHDLRTPLASITGTASSLLMDDEDISTATRKELLRSIHEEASRLAKTVTNLLDVTSLESGNVKLNKQLYFIEELIGSALMRVEERTGRRGIQADIPYGLPMVRIDGLLIEQVIVNLLENAVRHSDAEKAILIRGWTENDMLHIRVTDRGSGIAETEEKKIFEKYGPQMHHGKQGGLGLAICRGIILAHEGRIWAENNSEGGASFTFTLPVEHQPTRSGTLLS